MKTSTDCLSCFITQTLRTVRRCGGDAAAEEQAARTALRLLAEADLEQSAPVIAARLYPELYAALGSADPYAEVKRADNARLLAHYDRFAALVSGADDPLRVAVKLALAGNVIDLGAQLPESMNLERTVAQLLEVEPIIDEIDALAAALGRARRVLYLADNAGELVLDRLLIETLPPGPALTLAVRGGPVINDVTLEDARQVFAGCPRQPELIAPETTLPGVDLARSGPAFVEVFEAADLIIAKGQGNFETLDELAGRYPICFVFVVKCEVVARQLGLALGDPLVCFTPPT
jgi:damage-control phosphatase, subfamily I